jgi:predicted RNase H-like HicB family nuclease
MKYIKVVIKNGSEGSHMSLIMQATQIYTAVIHPSEFGGYYAVCNTSNGGCVTQGDTIQETQHNMFEAMELHFEDSHESQNYYIVFEICNA